jgi:hypothetical protein
MCGQFVRRLPGGDLKPLDFVPVASRDRLRSSALATRDSSGWHHSRPNIGFGSRSQPETALPSCASCWCASAQASIAPRWTFSQSPSGNVLEAPQSPQVTVRSGMGHSIHPAGAARAKRSWRLSPILSPNSPREAPPQTAEVAADLDFPLTGLHLSTLTQGPAVMIGRPPPPAAPKSGPPCDRLCHSKVAGQDTACRIVERASSTLRRPKTQDKCQSLRTEGALVGGSSNAAPPIAGSAH